MNYNFLLKEYRKKKGLSQQALAEMLGIAYQNISDYERGIQVPSLDRLVQIAQALNLSLDELVLFDKAHKEHSDELAEQFYKDKK